MPAPSAFLPPGSYPASDPEGGPQRPWLPEKLSLQSPLHSEILLAPLWWGASHLPPCSFLQGTRQKRWHVVERILGLISRRWHVHLDLGYCHCIPPRWSHQEPILRFLSWALTCASTGRVCFPKITGKAPAWPLQHARISGHWCRSFSSAADLGLPFQTGVSGSVPFFFRWNFCRNVVIVVSTQFTGNLGKIPRCWWFRV